jgi:hypothetical protein
VPIGVETVHFGKFPGGKMDLSQGMHGHASVLHIEYHPGLALRAFGHSKGADVGIEAKFSNENGILVMRIGDLPIPIPQRSSLKIVYYPETRGNDERVTEVRIGSATRDNDQYTVRFAGAPGDSIFKQVRVDVSKESLDSLGQCHAVNFAPRFTRQVDLNMIRAAAVEQSKLSSQTK